MPNKNPCRHRENMQTLPDFQPRTLLLWGNSANHCAITTVVTGAFMKCMSHKHSSNECHGNCQCTSRVIHFFRYTVTFDKVQLPCGDLASLYCTLL